MVAALKDFMDDTEQWAKQGVAKTTYAINNTAKLRAPVDDGNLKKSISTQWLDGGMTGIVHVGAFYALYIEFGTGIYSQKVSRAKTIPWRYKDEKGKWHTTKGQRAQPFWSPAIDKAERVFNKHFR